MLFNTLRYLCALCASVVNFNAMDTQFTIDPLPALIVLACLAVSSLNGS